MIWIIDSNVATEVTHLQKKHGSLWESSTLWDFAPSSSDNLASRIVTYPRQLLKSIPQSHIFFSPPPFAKGVHSMSVMLVVTCFCYLSFIMSQSWLSRMELTKFTPRILMCSCDRASCLGLSVLFLYAPAHKTWIFEKFVFELEAFLCDFKIDCILVWQLLSLTRKMMLSSGKFNIFWLHDLLSVLL